MTPLEHERADLVTFERRIAETLDTLANLEITVHRAQAAGYANPTVETALANIESSLATYFARRDGIIRRIRHLEGRGRVLGDGQAHPNSPARSTGDSPTAARDRNERP